MRPNDYNEYKIWKQKDRAEKRERLAEERRMDDRKRYRRGSSHTDSDHSDSDDERPRKTGMLNFSVSVFLERHVNFHFLGRYEDHYDRWSRTDDERPKGIGATHATPAFDPPVAINHDMSGEEAYQRRLAMSGGMRPLTPPAPPVNILPPQVFADDGDAIPGPPGTSAYIPPAESGEEAYLRRVAMSQVQARPPIPPSQSEMVEASSTLAYNPFAPPSIPPPPSGPPASLPSALEEKIKAAAAIAARLGALAAAAADPSAGPSSGSASPAPSVTQTEEEATSTKR